METGFDLPLYIAIGLVLTIIVVGMWNKFQPKEPKAIVIVSPHTVDRARQDGCEKELFLIADLISKWNINPRFRKKIVWKHTNVTAIVCGSAHFDSELQAIAARNRGGMPLVAIATCFRDPNIAEDGGPLDDDQGHIYRSRSR